MFGLKWITTKFKQTYEKIFLKETEQNLQRAVEYYHYRLRDAVSTPYPPASAPYFPPHLRTGFGRAAIQVERVRKASRDEFIGAVFVNPEEEGFYIALLDKGIPEKNILPRPFIEPTFLKYEKLLYDIARGRL
jgi:hypothetical protein